MNTCKDCKYFIGGGDWNLCCSNPPLSQAGWAGFLCYSDTEACENFDDRNHQAADCSYCAQFNRQLPVEENHFYRMAINGSDRKFHDCVVKCTKIQDFKKTAGYNVYHFKYSGGEIVVTDQNKGYVESFYNQGHEIKCEITDKEMCNTSIEFIDDNHYKKLVNKDTYKIYEVK